MGCTIVILAFLYFGYKWAMKQPYKPEVAARKAAEQRFITGDYTEDGYHTREDDLEVIIEHIIKERELPSCTNDCLFSD